MEEKSEKSTLTTAQNDAVLGDSAESSSQLTDSSSNSLDYITGLEELKAVDGLQDAAKSILIEACAGLGA
ncbi:hypothetical protein RIF29_27665 [Crotalaria pallida]|uniref:Uncharacterized protein n=1 Tax=Crotalaria pallida TaxID=3830 RepID=A0AAN9I5T8_CROPI